LTLAEAKGILASVQRTMITAQAHAYVEQQRVCPSCGTSSVCKGQHTLVVRTLFGTMHVPSPRFYTCGCQPQPTASWSPLAERLPERTAPEQTWLQPPGSSSFLILMAKSEIRTTHVW
jgi:hypothetical protein